MKRFPAISGCEILLPEKGIDLTKWSVVACDQFTSQPEYWEKAERIVGDAPSTLHLIQPEAFLSRGDHSDEISLEMQKYLDENILNAAVTNGFILVERTTGAGVRLGLMAALDLEDYDFVDETRLVRATEGTVADRLPPRVAIREKAPLELPHVMVLIDDPGFTVIEAMYERVKNQDPLYETELMLSGGHLRGWGIEREEELSLLSRALWDLHSRSGGLMYAVGDGNHSLATAKICWENVKKTLSPSAREHHPARFSLVELNNLHSPAIQFEAIHRVLFSVDQKELIRGFSDFASKKGVALTDGAEIVFLSGEKETGFALQNANGLLPVALLQEYLDRYLESHPGSGIDYVHGESVTRDLAKCPDTVGILLESIPKDSFFEGIRTGGHLPRKTFSMGHPEEKRYYFECRKIK